MSPGPSPERRQRLTEALRYTHSLLGLAQRQAWTDLGELLARRQELLHLVFVEPVGAAEEGEVVASLKEILAIDQQITTYLEAARDASSEQLAKACRGRRVALAYRENMG